MAHNGSVKFFLSKILIFTHVSIQLPDTDSTLHYFHRIKNSSLKMIKYNTGIYKYHDLQIWLILTNRNPAQN